MVPRILMSIGTIAESICLLSGVLLIESMKELQTIFHSKLKKLRLTQKSAIDVNINCNHIDSNTNKNKKNDKNNGIKIGDLESIELDLSHYFSFNELVIHSLNILNRFSIQRLIKTYSIDWKPDEYYFIGGLVENSNIIGILDKLLFQDYDKHPLLEKLVIGVGDEVDLSGFARLLIYFNDRYKKLFGDERKLYLKHFEKIEIEFRDIQSKIELHEPVDGEEYNQREMIFLQNSNQEYTIDLRIIEIANIKQGIEHFGIIYQNVFKWLQSIQNRSCDGAVNGHNVIDGHKVVLLIE